MIICFKCDQDTKQKMDILLQKNEYKDYSELIALAIENLWVLDQEVEENKIFIIDESTNTSRDVAPSKSTILNVKLSIPNLFKPMELDLESSAKTYKKIEKPTPKEFYTIDEWLFGQYNKLLPAKANCRAISALTANNENGIILNEAANQIAKAAIILGDYLADYDRRHNTLRNDALATAFPQHGPKSEKSVIRYINHFIGSTNKSGESSGLLWDYFLADLSTGDNPRILLTEAGARFSQMTNPILDGCQTDPIQKFSTEEINFLLDHIRTFVPEEAFAFRTLIQNIHEGANTPDKLHRALNSLIPNDDNHNYSESYLISQRSGAMSRMADLGLINRIRKGVRVTYAVTERGQEFLTSI